MNSFALSKTKILVYSTDLTASCLMLRKHDFLRIHFLWSKRLHSEEKFSFKSHFLIFTDDMAKENENIAHHWWMGKIFHFSFSFAFVQAYFPRLSQFIVLEKDEKFSCVPKQWMRENSCQWSACHYESAEIIGALRFIELL